MKGERVVAFERFVDKYIGAVLVIIVVVLHFILQIILFPIRLLNRNKKQTVTKILVIKLWALGDSAVSLPMIKALKTKYPKAKITVLARKRNADVFLACKYVDEVLLFEDISKVIGQVRKYNVVIDLEPYLNLSALLAIYLGQDRVGIGGQLRSILYKKTVKFTAKKHFAQVYLDMARALGINYDTDQLIPLEVSRETKEKAERIFKANGINKKDKVYGICAGVAESVKSREWPSERFAGLADQLLEKHCDKIIFVGGPAEKEMIEEILRKMKSKRKNGVIIGAINLAGKTSIKESFYIIQKCRIFISNDTGPMHIAAAQGCKTIGLFGPNTPVLWAPYGKNNKSIYKGAAVCKYSPCIRNIKGYMPNCLIGENKCMKAIQVKDVLRAVTELEKTN